LYDGALDYVVHCFLNAWRKGLLQCFEAETLIKHGAAFTAHAEAHPQMRRECAFIPGRAVDAKAT
jgi:hypothetical protein